MSSFRMRQPLEMILSQGDKDPLLSFGAALGALSAVFGGAMALRAELYRRGLIPSRRLSCPVVSVGNLTLGGTGKTPMVVYLAGRLQASGLRPAVVSRGYGGRMQRSGGVVSDGRRILAPPDAAGDEPWMIADRLPGVPVVVGADRWRAGRLAEEAFSPDLVLLDDGFQHIRLRRDLNLLLLDAGAPVGNGRIFPRGLLREPRSAAARADAVVLTRSSGDASETTGSQWRLPREKPVFRAVHIPRLRRIVPPAGAGGAAESGHALANRRVLAFSGIARNDAFLASIRELGAQPAVFCAFPDHHRYRRRDRIALDAAAARAGVELLATTEKDFARLGGKNPFATALAVVGVDVELVSGNARLDRLLAQRLGVRVGD